MSKTYFKPINLLLPVYKGQDLFPGALLSVEESAIEFANIFISFNGANADDYEFFMGMLQNNNLQKKYVIFRTMAELTAVEHGLFIIKNLQKILESSSLLMLLAHDDRLTNIGNAQAESEFFSHLREDTIYIPTYKYCWAPDYHNVTKVFENEISMSPSHFFWKSMTQTIPTNMSGMIVPFFAYTETVRVNSVYSNGARFEHLLCIARSIVDVRFNKVVCVLIGERMNSDGRLLTTLEHRTASLHFMKTYWRNGRLDIPGEVPRFLLHIFKKYLGYWLARLQIG
jgi:hypothetical protein